MKTKVLTALLWLNVCLFGFGFYYFGTVKMARDTRKPPSSALPSAADVRQRLLLARNKKPALTSLPSSVVYVTNHFDWQQVESADYREYIANLRAIGCPESTIKDIIMADVMKLYAAKRGQFYHNGREFKFWETNEKRKLHARQLEEREKQLAAIDKEIPAVLRELLGINYERELNKYFVDANEDERRLDFLSSDQRRRILALRDEMEGLRERVAERALDGKFSEADLVELRKIEEQRQTALANILSPSELEEFTLRTSETAEQLRETLIGFNPSEEEFRQLYLLQQSAEGHAERMANLAVAIRNQLGEARYAEYQQAQNPDYRNICLFAELYELPSSTAPAIFEIKQIAEQEKKKFLENPTVPLERRAEVLAAIRQETEKSLLQVLGTKALIHYTQSTGQWLQELGRAN